MPRFNQSVSIRALKDNSIMILGWILCFTRCFTSSILCSRRTPCVRTNFVRILHHFDGGNFHCSSSSLEWRWKARRQDCSTPGRRLRVMSFLECDIYRVFFHSLNSFSGPLMARATKLCYVSKTLRTRNYMLLQKMHEESGEFVRTDQFHTLSSIKAQRDINL